MVKTGGGGAGDGAPQRNASKSLRRALKLLDAVARSDSHPGRNGLAALAATTALHKSTLVRLAAPLVEIGLLQREDQTGGFSLGPYAAYLGGVFLGRLELRAVARVALLELAQHSGETAHLVIPDGVDVVYVDKAEGTGATRLGSRVGSRQPMYCTAVGKAILAHLPDDAIRRVVDAGMTPRTPNTRTSERALRADITSGRALGFFVDDVEHEAGIRCIASPIFDHDGNVVAALSVSGPDGRVTSDDVPALGALTIEAASGVSRRLGFPQVAEDQ